MKKWKSVVCMLLALVMALSMFPAAYATEKNDHVTEEEPVRRMEFNGHIYEVYDKSMTWKEAKAFCEKQGGYLVTITSSEEQGFIEKLLPDPCTKWKYWIGATS